MKKIVLCGHTGSMNRGCEAIVRSTNRILKRENVNVKLMSFKPEQDAFNGVTDDMAIIPYPQKNLFNKAAGFVTRKFLHNPVWGSRFYHKELFSSNAQPDIIFNIGGDTYCYDKPYLSYALNLMAKEKKVPTIFWGCSVDENILTDSQMQEDVNRYSHILTRESISYGMLKSVLHDDTKLHLVCDPAFHLKAEEVELPKEFIKGQCVGINLSPLVFRNKEDMNDTTYKSAIVLIDYILSNTELSICLIPHVYSIKECSQDYLVLSRLYELYKDNSRVCIIDKELNCMQLKYCVSQCRYFIGARTHSVIAAYSTNVPVIALSYSVKSRGIAKDLMGTEKGFAISWKDLEEDTLVDLFVNVLVKNEEQIKQRYTEILPDYKNTIIECVDSIMRDI